MSTPTCECCSRIWDNGQPPPIRPAAARWNHRNGNTSLLCQPCLNCWFDNADDDPSLEPMSWQWLPRPATVLAQAAA